MEETAMTNSETYVAIESGRVVGFKTIEVEGYDDVENAISALNSAHPHSEVAPLHPDLPQPKVGDAMTVNIHGEAC